MYMSILYACVYVHCVHMCPKKSEGGMGFPHNWSSRRLWASMRVLGTNPVTSSVLTAKPSFYPLTALLYLYLLLVGYLIVCSNGSCLFRASVFYMYARSIGWSLCERINTQFISFWDLDFIKLFFFSFSLSCSLSFSLFYSFVFLDRVSMCSLTVLELAL